MLITVFLVGMGLSLAIALLGILTIAYSRVQDVLHRLWLFVFPPTILVGILAIVSMFLELTK